MAVLIVFMMVFLVFCHAFMSKKLKILGWLNKNLLLLMFSFVISAFSIFLVLAWYYGHYFDNFFPTSELRADWGVLGDFFGGILNPIFLFSG